MNKTIGNNQNSKEEEDLKDIPEGIRNYIELWQEDRNTIAHDNLIFLVNLQTRLITQSPVAIEDLGDPNRVIQKLCELIDFFLNFK